MFLNLKIMHLLLGKIMKELKPLIKILKPLKMMKKMMRIWKTNKTFLLLFNQRDLVEKKMFKKIKFLQFLC